MEPPQKPTKLIQVNLFDFIEAAKTHSTSEFFKEDPERKISLEWNSSSSRTINSEGYLDRQEQIQRTLGSNVKVSFSKNCDFCTSKLSLTDNSTYIECGICGFGNDLCLGCRSDSDLMAAYVNPETGKLYECFEGVGCCDSQKKRFVKSQTRESPF